MNTVAQPLSDGMQTEREAHSSRRTSLSAPIPDPRVETSPCAATQASSGSAAPPFPIPPEASAFEVEQRFRAALSDDPWLAAWRESQGVPSDAIPRTGDWPYTANREGEIIDMRDGEVAYELMAQLGLGIKGF